MKRSFKRPTSVHRIKKWREGHRPQQPEGEKDTPGEGACSSSEAARIENKNENSIRNVLECTPRLQGKKQMGCELSNIGGYIGRI